MFCGNMAERNVESSAEDEGLTCEVFEVLMTLSEPFASLVYDSVALVS